MDNVQITIRSWVESFTDALYDRALYKTDNEEIAKDLVQDTFLAAFESFGSYEGKSNPKTWLMSILNHKIIDHYRMQYKNPIQKEFNSDPHFFDEQGMWQIEQRPGVWDCDQSLLDNRDFILTLKKCIAKLPTKWLSIVQLKYLSEKGGEEVCQELNIAPTNYWQMMRRAKMNLRECLKKNWFKQ
ncbi:MAG: sigma-70 family RNA polymerase sigma factor [Flavipsychrobacter sp.]|nr:sigma-70 family RNA polymerase sigma factor [Flavipsychrobacter sp.]